MTAPNEAFAVAVLGILDPALIVDGRPDFTAMDKFNLIASSGERVLLIAAQEAWMCTGITGAFGRLDKGTASKLLAALNESYAHLAPAPALEPAKPAIPGQRTIHDQLADQLAADAFMVDDHCELCGEPSSECECDNCLECGKHFLHCTCETAEAWPG